jgi:hypothetical protein
VNFNFIKLDNLPKLSWAAQVNKNAETIDVYCGPWIETDGHCFVEGAWNSPFEDKDFEKATVFMGSGGKALRQKAVFSAATHTLERLFAIRQDGSICISNSLSFALSLSKSELNPGYIAYQADYDSITLGFKKAVKSFPLKGGRKITTYCHCNIEVDDELNIIIIPKQPVRDFPDFTDYMTFLCSTLREIAQNSLSKHRSRQYSLLATASSGYDSSCVAAIAREVGCSEVLTIRNARGPKVQYFGRYRYDRYYREDSGEAIAGKLGYKNIIVRDSRDNLEEETHMLEAESSASGNLCYDPTVIFEDDIRQRVVLTGHHGDVVWAMEKGKVSSDLKWGGLSGASLYESRLRIGFIHAPVPYMGACSIGTINKISYSDEMRPWVLNSGYNRPIPRRVLEERGVPRDAFGQKKNAIQVVFIGSKNNTLSKMTSASAQSFLQYYVKHKRCRNIIKQLYYDFMTCLYLTSIALYVIPRKLRIPVRFKIFHKLMHEYLFKFSRSPRSASFLFPWGVSVTKKRYSIEQ